MTPAALLLEFPQMMASLIWAFSEEAGIPIGDTAPIVFGLSIGAKAVIIDCGYNFGPEAPC